MEATEETICAVVVTYNRRKLLLECLESLLNQTHPLDAIYIIDNASTDGTAQALKGKGYIKEEVLAAKEEPGELEHDVYMLSEENKFKVVKVYYVRMHQNTGGAGGFYEGVKRGYHRGYDWLWLMDDDVKAVEGALATLLKYKNISQCIYPRKIFFDGKPFYWEKKINPKLGNITLYKDVSFEKNARYAYATTGCFEGALIHREIIANIGFPDKRFFITGDDAVYGFLASLFTKPIYVREVCFIKLRRSPVRIHFGRASQRPSDTILYYTVRNKFLVEKYFQKVLGCRVRHKPYILFDALRRVIGICAYDKSRLRRVRIVIKALRDGYRLSQNFDINIPGYGKK